MEKDFGDEETVVFRYIANEGFKNEILIPTITAALSDSDTSELFLRSTKMLELFGILDLNSAKKEKNQHPRENSNSGNNTLLHDLRKVGFSTFVEYYEYFESSIYDTGAIRALLQKSGRYKINSCKTKASVGKHIIVNGYGLKALEIIANSNNVDPKIINKAKALLQKTIH